MSRPAPVRALPITGGPTLAQAILNGSYLEILLAQRREIVETLPDQRGPAKAALHRQLTLLSKRSRPSGRRRLMPTRWWRGLLMSPGRRG